MNFSSSQVLYDSQYIMKCKQIPYFNTKQNKRRIIINYFIKKKFILFLLVTSSKEGDELGFVVASGVNALVAGG